MKNNKQNKLTFADKARKIQNRYARAKFDPIEKADMEAELEALMAEQEQVREMLGLNQQEQPMQQFGYGGKMMYPDGGGINSWQDYIGGMPNIYDRVLNPPLQQQSDINSNPLVKDYLGGLPNIYDRAVNTPMQQLPNSISRNSGLVSTPGNEFLYNTPTTTTITKPTTTAKTNKATSKIPTIPQSTVQPFTPANELMYRTNNNSLVSNSDFAKFHSVGRLGQQPIDTKTLGNMNTLSPEQIATMQQQAKDAGYGNAGNEESFWNKNKQYLPYAISGASNIAGNLLMAAMAKKNQQRINPVLATPERMNMEPQAEQFRKDASVSKNIGLRQARDLGLNAGATLANMGAIGSGVDRNLANTLTNLYGQQEQYNTGAANQFALQNQDAVNRAGMMNAQFGQQANQDRLGYIGGALGMIPGVMKDIRMDKADKETRGIMEKYYSSLGGRNYLPIGSIFGEGAFKYKVKGYNPDGTPITEKVK